MDVCKVMFNQLKKRIVQHRYRYFLNDHRIPVSVFMKKVITSNTRRNLRAIMAENVVFSTTTQDNSEYMSTDNSIFKEAKRSVKLGKREEKVKIEILGYLSLSRVDSSRRLKSLL